MDQATIDRIRAELADYCSTQPVRLVVLFGSQADGRARPDSDVDIAVQLMRGGTLRTVLAIGGCVEDAVGTATDVVSLEDASATLALRVAQDGIPLYEAAPGDWDRFWLAAYREYEDTAGARRLQWEVLRRKLEAMS